MDEQHSNVLIVDDDPAIGQLLKSILSDEGFTITLAQNASEAVRLINSANYQMIFVDLNLPDKNGMDVVREAKHKDPDIPVLVITGYSSIESAIEAIQQQVFDYIAKPFSKDRIRLAARNAMNRYSLTRENRNLVNKLFSQEEELQRKIYQATQELRDINDELQKLVRTDPLTGLLNHRYFHERLDEEVQKTLRYKQTLSLMMIDVDDFKKINDNFGHPEGDKVIRLVGRLIKENMRSVDLVARYGGDEFAVILPQTHERATVVASEKLRRIITRTKFDLIHDIFPTGLSVSIGIATIPNHAKTIENLTMAADQALYSAKREGKNRVSLPVFTDSPDV